MKKGKISSAPGPDGVSSFWIGKAPKSIKEWFYENAMRFFEVNSVMERGWNDSHLFLLPKVPNPQSVGEIRPIALCNFTFKFVADCLQKQLSVAAGEKLIGEHQKAFPKGKQTLEHVATLKDLIASHKGGTATFVDIQRAYPSVPRGALWECLSGMGLNQADLCLVSKLYDNSRMNPLCPPLSCQGVPEKWGVKQGCPLSPLLFSLYMEPLIRHLQSLFPGLTTLCFADDIVVYSPPNTAPQVHVDFLQLAAQLFASCGLQFNLRKTVYMSFSGLVPPPPLQQVPEFKYLGRWFYENWEESDERAVLKAMEEVRLTCETM